ncbi:asparagine synthase B [Kiritimatiella glycovorans]|uniref:asparagine synthase (glutamine-hydrolyzing) n=1 Tax=Kiritimatiella glycovorans TaxID=1307763 RepID=A0A0G3EF80_9BACT|nr:asparagine synthase B [Kiritimatiella glycovorans]AKJ64993.1 Asparagine synthetase B (glutamine-hydrolyzing) [Kiritimatiella glycovorans]
MCGIAALWNQRNDAMLDAMLERVVHRGPDEHGTHHNRRGSLGHRRLSIMDPEGGHQPILSGDGRRAVIANGEIYNFPSLRPELEKEHRFRSRSDSEAPLHLYEDLADRAADRLDGMYAFVVADDEQLYAARDPVGIKPLYLGRTPEGPVFGSELKQFDGLTSEVREFPPGTCYHTEHGWRTFAPIPEREPEEGRSTEDWCSEIRTTLTNSVTKRMMSDVPVGAFLSGGLDSSLIAAIIRRQVEELHTFSVGVEGSRDIQAARLVARHIGSIHHEYVFTEEEVRDALPEILYHLESFDQDLVRSAIPCYFTSRLAAQHVKVIHTGEGADELFAGYTYVKDIDHHDDLHNELYRSVTALHNINLQRVDRLTMAHSLEGRVPFLDLDMIELAQRIPARFKLWRDEQGQPVEKWILRKAFEDLLPEEIVWRGKEQFDEGSGTVDIIERGIRHFIRPETAAEYSRSQSGHRLRSPEECAYHKVLADQFETPELVLSNVGRWADRPEGNELPG